MSKEKLPLGMSKKPYGFPVMFGDFLGCAEWAIGKEGMRASFKEDTGIDICSVVPKNHLEEMIDKATGNTHKEAFSQFLDWLVVNYWGED